MNRQTDPVNYDAISDTYNQRYQNNPRTGTLKALQALLSQNKPEYILEVGCGTGHWLEGLKPAQKHLYGLDASFGMLMKARRILSGHLMQGVASRLPIANNQMSLLYCVNALHHFPNKANFYHETWRTIAPGGTLAIIGMDPGDRRNRWYIYDFFEGTRERDLSRFPRWSEVESELSGMGFVALSRKIADVIHDPKTINTVLSDPFLKKASCSQLALLSPQAYQEGLARVRAAVQDPKQSGRIFENDIFLEILIAKKPF
jgi:ubiquinone/menaquinone biosynthesis C-methylase UbiE